MLKIQHQEETSYKMHSTYNKHFHHTHVYEAQTNRKFTRIVRYLCEHGVLCVKPNFPQHPTTETHKFSFQFQFVKVLPKHLRVAIWAGSSENLRIVLLKAQHFHLLIRDCKISAKDIHAERKFYCRTKTLLLWSNRTFLIIYNARQVPDNIQPMLCQFRL